MKKLSCVLFLFFVLLLFPGTIQAKTQNAFEFYIVSEGENTCRIAEIRIKKDKGISELTIPSTINGKTVVSIGPNEPHANSGVVDQNVFCLYQLDDHSYDDYWDWLPYDDAQKRRAMRVKKIILPDTVRVLKKSCFAAMRGLETVKLSKNLTVIESEAFAATSIRKMHLPSSLTAIKGQIFLDSPIRNINIPEKLKEGVTQLARVKASWKRFAVSEKNPYYKVKKGMLYSKDGKTLYAMLKFKKAIRIPNHVKTVAEGVFYNRSMQSVHLGAGVEKIEYGALSTRKKCKITLSSRNPYLAKAGMCLYHKRNRSLLVGIPKSRYERISAKIARQKIYYLKISRKIKKLDNDISIVGVGKKYKVRKVYIPKSVKTIVSGWSIGGFVHKKCTYITERDYWTFRS